MHVIKARNVHQMLPVALAYMLEHGKGQESRNGPVVRLTEPCALVYEKPTERVIFHPERDANPFFHLLEACWMLCGRRDVAFPAHYVKRMASFSDDGVVFNAAYGYRWRNHFGQDQLWKIIDALKVNRDCRRQVLAIWDGRHDLGLESKDLPCNTQATFQIVDGVLDMVVSNRSNDLVWGACGANAVHFSFLQEWMALAIGVPVGRYWQVSSNLHVYVKQHAKLMETPLSSPDLYGGTAAKPIMGIAPEAWMAELSLILDQGGEVMGIKDPFLKRVLLPMMQAHKLYLNREFKAAKEKCKDIADLYWAVACEEWLERRRIAQARADRAMDDGVIYE